MRMIEDRATLSRINDLSEPRHIFVLPGWLSASTLDRLLDQGFLACTHRQRDENGLIHVAMDVRLTNKGRKLIEPETNWQNLFWKGSVAGMSFTAMSLLILYLG